MGKTGFTFIGIGAVIVLAAVVVMMLLGHFVFKLTTDDLFGVVSGATGSPAITAYSNQMVPSERIDVGYATIYPSMTIMKMILAQVVLAMLGAG